MPDNPKIGWRLTQLFEDLEHPTQRYGAIRELGEIDHPHADVAILAALMNDDDPTMLSLAAEAAGKRKLEAAREKLEALRVHDGDEEKVRAAATEALAKLD